MITTDNSQTLANAMTETERLSAANSALNDEIGLLNSIIESRNRNIETLRVVVSMKSKMIGQAFYVLEQASQWFDWFHGDDKTLDAPLSTDVHDAIKEVLKWE